MTMYSGILIFSLLCLTLVGAVLVVAIAGLRGLRLWTKYLDAKDLTALERRISELENRAAGEAFRRKG